MDVFTMILEILNDERADYSILKEDKIIRLDILVKEAVFCYIVGKFIDLFGDPKFVDAYYGYIWSAEGKFFSFNAIETGYNIENMYIHVFKKLPFSKRMNYKDYIKLDGTIETVLDQHKFYMDNFIHYTIGNEYLCFGQGMNHVCAISIKRNRMKVSLSERRQLSETSYRPILIFDRKFKINRKDLKTIRGALSLCLSSLKNDEM